MARKSLAAALRRLTASLLHPPCFQAPLASPIGAPDPLAPPRACGSVTGSSPRRSVGLVSDGPAIEAVARWAYGDAARMGARLWLTGRVTVEALKPGAIF